MINLLPSDGEVYYLPELFSEAERDAMMNDLLHTIQWKQDPIKMFGKTILQPRLTALYGDAGVAYRYSGLTMHPIPWTATLLKIKALIEPIAAVSFTTVLLNLYRDGSDSMGWHRDNEKSLGPEPVIASVSFGATRRFQIRNYSNKQVKHSIDLASGSLLLMKGKTQENWEHQVPKSSKGTDPRINLTFRTIQVN